MLKKSKVLGTILLVLLLCLGSLTTAFTTDTNEHGALVGSETNPVQLGINKIFRMPAGTNVPESTFRFTAKPISVDEDESGEAIATMPALNNLEVIFENANATVAPDGSIATVTDVSGNIFQNVKFPHAGIYVYEITENVLTSEVTGGSDDLLIYSKAVYEITVYVANNRADAGTYVSAVGIYNIRDEAGMLLTNEDKVDKITFTNDYVKTNNVTDPTKGSTLFVSKDVAGDLANREQHFDFSITVTTPSIVPNENVPAYFKAYIVDNNIVLTDLTDNAKDDIISPDGRYIMVSTKGATEFSLKHGQRLVFVDTPVGTSYAVTEVAATNYEAEHVITTNNVAGGTIETLATGTQFVGEVNNSAAYTNTRNFVAPMGLSLNNLPFIVLILLALGALITFIVVKVRNRKYYN